MGKKYGIKAIYKIFKSNGFLFGLLLMVMYTIMIPNHVYYKDIFSLIALFALMGKCHDKTAYRLLFFSVSYSIIVFVTNGYGSYFELLSYLIVPTSFYLLGKYFTRNCQDNEDIIMTFAIIAFFSSIALWKNNILDAKVNGVVNITRTIIVEGNEYGMSATLQGLIASFCLSLAGYVVSLGKKQNTFSFLVVVSVFLSLFCVIHLVNRTGLVVVMAGILMAYSYMYRFNFKSIVYISISFIVFYIVISHIGLINNDLIEAYEERNLSAAGDIRTAGSRFEIWARAISKIPAYPFGWNSISQGYSHNLWLDVARRSGWIPLISLCFITFTQIKRLKALYNRKNDIFISFFVSSISCLLLAFSVEPVIEAVSSAFAMLCLIWGMQNEYAIRIGVMTK